MSADLHLCKHTWITYSILLSFIIISKADTIWTSAEQIIIKIID